MNLLFSDVVVMFAWIEMLAGLLLLISWKRMAKDRELFFNARKDTYRSLEKLTVQSVKDSQKLLEQATVKQQNLFNTIDKYGVIFDKQLTTILETHATDFKKMSDQQLEQTVQTLTSHLKAHTDILVQATEKNMSQLDQYVDQLKGAYQEQFEAYSAKSLANVESELALYTNQQKELVAKKIETITAAVAQDFFLESSDQKSQHTTVMKLVDKHLLSQ